MDIGAVLNNRYNLLARLGKGAMGTVFRAQDTRTGEEVALKVLAADLTLDPDMIARFRREGEALRQLRHPNIVSLVDIFENEGQQVIAMEYVRGGSLYQLLQQGPLPVERARRLALELCDAIARAHYLNVIHRDLKPENVLVTEEGTPKLTDFGVAKLVGEGTRLTSTGTMVGTPFYMSPEAWQGQPLDAQTDVWSLGVILYEMLAGQVPFGGETMAAVMNKVLTAPLPDLKPLRPDVPPEMIRIIRKMLTRDKAKRYGSMREVGLDLERVRKDLDSRASAPPRKEAAKPAAITPAAAPPPAQPAAAPALLAAQPEPGPSAPAETPTVLAPPAEVPTLLASAAGTAAAPEPAVEEEAATILAPSIEAITLSAAAAEPEPPQARPAPRISPLVVGASILALLVVVGLIAAAFGLRAVLNSNFINQTTQTALAAARQAAPTPAVVSMAPTQALFPAQTSLLPTQAIPTSTEPPTKTAAPSNTPAPKDTPTPSGPSASAFQAMLDGAQLILKDTFDNSQLPGLYVDPALVPKFVFVKNGFVTILGQSGNNPPAIYTQSALRDNAALLGLLRFSSGANFYFGANTTDWPSPNFRAWGIQQAPEGITSIHTVEGPNTRSAEYPISPAMIADRWYYVLLWLRGSGRITVRIWEKDNPDAFAQKDWESTDNWAGRIWVLQFMASSGTVEMDTFEQLRFAPQP